MMETVQTISSRDMPRCVRLEQGMVLIFKVGLPGSLLHHKMSEQYAAQAGILEDAKPHEQPLNERAHKTKRASTDKMLTR